MKPVLVIDADSVCARGYHVMPFLSHEGRQTSVAFAALQTYLDVSSRLHCAKVVWCFDGAKPLERQKISPIYKEGREARQAKRDSMKGHESLAQQKRFLREVLIPETGMVVASEKGIEADDWCALYSQKDYPTILLSSDKDLYQCLSEKCKMWDSGKKALYTFASLFEEYKVFPSQWARLKAIAGCSSDGVVGVRGVADLSAARFLAGTLRAGSAKRLIETSGRLIERNLELVTLPLPNWEPKELPEPKKVNSSRLREVLEKYGMEKLLSRVGA
jgi:5'-3' exonuclease